MATNPQQTPRNFTLADVVAGSVDRLGYTIECLYAVSPDFAVYRSNKRVSVQYSDSPVAAHEQLKRLAPLNMLRGQISSLIDGWRDGADPSEHARIDINRFGRMTTAGLNRKRAERYDRQVADALLSGLQGQIETAKNQLGEIKNDIVSERQSIARIDYLIVSLAMAAGLILVTWILSAAVTTALIGRFGEPLLPVWTAAAGGTLGAFFSIATGIKSRTVLIDLQNRDNRADAALRMLIGAISGGVLLCMLSSELLANALVKLDGLRYPGAHYSDLLVYMLGFLGGFAERLVPDQLENARLAIEDKAPAKPGTPPTPDSPPPAPPPPPGGADMLGLAPDVIETADAPGEASAGAPNTGTGSAN